MPRWEPIDLPTPKAAEAAKDRGVRLPQQFVTEFDTRLEAAPAQRAAFFLWLNDPLPCFTGAWRHDFVEEAREQGDDVAAQLDGLALEGVDGSWKVVTVLQNHHRRLNPRINMVRATVSYEEETVYVDVYKQLDGSDASGTP